MKSNYCSPLLGQYELRSIFGRRIHPTENKIMFHNGVDIDNDTGQPVYAIDDGVIVSITRAAPSADPKYKWTAESIKIQHNDLDIVYSFYTHLHEGSTNHLKKGDKVTAGQEIGKLGNTGRSTGAHLHFEVRGPGDAKNHLDPYNLLTLTSDLVSRGEWKENQDGTKTKVRPEFRSGKYYSSDNSDPPAPLPLLTQPVGPGEAAQLQKQKEREEQKEQEKLDPEEIRASLIGYYMPEIIQQKQSKPSPKNLIFLNGKENTAALSNIVFSKTSKDFTKITNLELANMVPFVELYSLRNNGESVQETLYPFDDYTTKTKIESIFYDKTGRGGNIGIKSLDWEILATNPSNRSQISAKLKIYIQDIQEIESIRNGISLIDFLYPVGKRDDTFEPHNFNVKIKLGWLYKREGNSTLSDLDKKIEERNLQEVMHLCLAKHVFDFMEDGSVELTLDYFGMIETSISNPNKTNILDKLAPAAKSRERVVKWWKSILEIFDREEADKYLIANIEKLNADPDFRRFGIKITQNAPSLVSSVGTRDYTESRYGSPRAPKKKPIFKINFDNLASQIDFQQEYDATVVDWIKSKFDKNEIGTERDIEINSENIQKIVNIAKAEIAKAEKEQARTYRSGLANLLNTLQQEQNIVYLKVPATTIEQLREYSISDNTFSAIELDTFAKLKNQADTSINLNLPSNISEAINIKENAEFGGSKFIFDQKEFRKTITKQYEKETGSVGDMIIPYTHLDYVLSYYINLFYGQKDVKEVSDLRIVLGSFSYRDLGDLASVRNVEGSGAPNSNSNIKYKERFLKKLKFAKKYANLGDMPISIESLLKWYNTNILDADLAKMSFHTFLKSLINDIIPANVTNNILPFVPSRSIPISINYITTPEIQQVEKELQNISNNNKAVGNNKNYTIDLSGKKYKNTSFYHFTDKAIQDSRSEKNKNINYMFLFSSLERDDFLVGDYSQDLDKNIYHFYIGEENGLVKKLKFTREDNKQLDAANIIKANNGDSDTSIMRQIYNLDMEMFGNTIFQPGHFLHLVPTFPGARLKNKTLYDIGLGGYYQITKISSYIDDNEFKTSIKGHWQFSGMDTERDRQDAFVYQEEEQQEEELDSEVKEKVNK